MRLSLVVCVCVYRYCLGVCLCIWLRNDQCVCVYISSVCLNFHVCVCVCVGTCGVCLCFAGGGLRGQQLPFTSAALTRYGFPHGSENTDVMYERMSATPPGVTQETDMKLKSIRPADSFSLLFLSLSLSPSVSHRSYSPSTSPSFSPPRIHPCCSLVSHFCLPLS